jgi:hypothetical protein
MPYRFYPHDSQAGRQLLREAGQDGSRLPVVIFRTGQVLVDPSHAELQPDEPADVRASKLHRSWGDGGAPSWTLMGGCEQEPTGNSESRHPQRSRMYSWACLTSNGREAFPLRT